MEQILVVYSEFIKRMIEHTTTSDHLMLEQ